MGQKKIERGRTVMCECSAFVCVFFYETRSLPFPYSNVPFCSRRTKRVVFQMSIEYISFSFMVRGEVFYLPFHMLLRS